MQSDSTLSLFLNKLMRDSLLTAVRGLYKPAFFIAWACSKNDFAAGELRNSSCSGEQIENRRAVADLLLFIESHAVAGADSTVVSFSNKRACACMHWAGAGGAGGTMVT